MAARCMINYENFENLCVIITSLVAIDSTNGLYGDMVIKPLLLAFFLVHTQFDHALISHSHCNR